MCPGKEGNLLACIDTINFELCFSSTLKGGKKKRGGRGGRESLDRVLLGAVSPVATVFGGKGGGKEKKKKKGEERREKRGGGISLPPPPFSSPLSIVPSLGALDFGFRRKGKKKEKRETPSAYGRNISPSVPFSNPRDQRKKKKKKKKGEKKVESFFDYMQSILTMEPKEKRKKGREKKEEGGGETPVQKNSSSHFTF